MRLRSRFLGEHVAKDTIPGYPVWRSWSPWIHIAYVVRRESPDLIVVMPTEPVRMALAARSTGVPILVQLMDVEFHTHGGPFEELGSIACIANSSFTAGKYREAYGVHPTVIYPFIAPRKYKTRTTRQNVTFINPVPLKGRDIALEVARLCPEIPFSFVKGWPIEPKQRHTLMEKLSALPNVRLRIAKRYAQGVR